MIDFDIIVGLKKLSLYAIPILFGVILHELAHAWVANRKGDPTAAALGRMTLDPRAHLDTSGVMVFVVTSLFSPFAFGWAKPVPIDTRYFKNPMQDMMLVSLAGPMANFFLAFLFGAALAIYEMLFPIEIWAGSTIYSFIYLVLMYGIIINFGLAWLNLIPVPPLDGSKVLAYFLPKDLAEKYLSLERYGFLILIGLIVLGFLGPILGPLIRTCVTFVSVIFDLKIF